MLTKGQKIIMYLIGALSLVIGIITFIPFRIVPFFANSAATLEAEMIVKLVIFPLLVIGMSVYPNLVKYGQIYDCRERSKVINVMSYLPSCTYIVAILVFILHTLSYNSSPLGPSLWAASVLLVAGYLVFMLVLSHFVDAISMRLSKIGSIIADSLVGVIIIALAISAWRVSVQYAEYASHTQAFYYGDPLIFCILIVAAFALYYAIKGLIKLITVDEWSVYISATDATDNLPNIAVAEYNRAYNNILDDFENYFAELTEEESEDEEDLESEEDLEAVEEETPAEEAKEEEAPAEEAKEEEAPAEEAKEEEASAEEAKEEKAPAEEAKEEKAPAEEAKEEEAPAEEAKEEEASAEEAKEEKAPAEEAKEEEAPAEEAKEEAPKPVKEPKVLSPSFDEVLEKARAIEGGSEVSNEAKTVYKFSYEKKLFLILQKTSNDYRVAFLADNEDILKYIIKYPRVIIKPSSPKGDNWLLLINKNAFDAELLENIMNNSLKTLKRLLEEAKAAKEAEKAAKAAAKKAAK